MATSKNEESIPNLRKRLAKEVDVVTSASIQLKKTLLQLESRLNTDTDEHADKETMTDGSICDSCGCEITTSESLVFANHLILSCIFKHMDISSAKAARQVCKTWNQSATSALGKKSTIRLESEDKLNSFLEEKIPNQLVQNLDSRKFEPNGFLKKHGSNLVSLVVSYISDKSLHSILEKKCINLRKIELSFVSRMMDAALETFTFIRPLNLRSIQMIVNNNYSHTVLFQLLKESPNLTHLNVEYKAIIKSDNNAYLVDLKHLRALTITCFASGPEREIFITTLTNGVLSQVEHLAYLNLQTEVSILRNLLVTANLTRFKDSLESLVLMTGDSGWYSGHGREMIPFPVLNKLKLFKVQSHLALGINSLGFLNTNMPNLEVLQIWDAGDEIHELFRRLEFEPHQNLKAISVGNPNLGLIHEKDILSLKAVFPNVSQMDLFLRLRRNGYGKNGIAVWFHELFQDFLPVLKLKRLSVGFDISAERSVKTFNYLKGLKYLKGVEVLSIRYGRNISSDILHILKEVIREIPELRKIILIGAKFQGALSELFDIVKMAKDFGVEMEFFGENEAFKGYFCVDKPSYY